MTVIDLSPRGLERVKQWTLFIKLRHVWGFRRLHKHCGALGYWCCEGCGGDIEKASAQQKQTQTQATT